MTMSSPSPMSSCALFFRKVLLGGKQVVSLVCKLCGHWSDKGGRDLAGKFLYLKGGEVASIIACNCSTLPLLYTTCCGVIERNTPIHAVKKADGTWRVCGDFRRLNTITALDRYPLPALTSFNEQLAGCDTFSKIDLRQAFQQVRVDEASQLKTAIITTIGLFKFLRMPFGLKNAAQCFQRNVHHILRDLPFSCFIYMDDIIVGSNGAEDHIRDLRSLFQRLKDSGLLLNKKKCQLGQSSLTFLGHVVDANGISIPRNRVEAIKRYSTPKTPKDLERFLGICAFFHRFVRHASGKMAPLAKLKNISRQQEFEDAWLPIHDQAFASMKDAIANTTLLVHPLPFAATEIWCDASNTAIGAVLVQFQCGLWKPLSFWSKQLNRAQCGYSATDRELLAVSYSVDKFRSYLEGQPIVVRTDHLPLVGSLTKKADTALPIPRRHLLKIAQFVDQLCYLKGEHNVGADALSRITLQPADDAPIHAVCSSSHQLGDTLPDEGSLHAVTDEALVDDTFLPLIRKEHDLTRQHLSTPTCVPEMTPMIEVDTTLPHAGTSSVCDDAAIPSTTPNDSCASSVSACHAIFAPQSTTGTQLPTAQLMRDEQDRDVSLQKWIGHHRTSSSNFSPELTPCENGIQVWADVTASHMRILVPTALQRAVFDSLHNVSHPGVKAGMMLIKRTYWWHSIGKDIAQWTKTCVACQKATVHKHTTTSLVHLPAPTKRFSHIHVDLVGPLNPPCEGKNMLLTVIDRWTGWPEAFAMTMHGDAANAKACATMLLRQWIARWGVPDIITSDRGSQFTSDLWREICQLMGIARDQTTSYHPQHNGKVERMHRSMKNALRARLLGKANWLSQLPWVMLGLRAASNLDTGVSPAILVTGQQPTLPGQLVVQRANIDDASVYGKELASAMSSQRFTENPWHGQEKTRNKAPHDLWTARHVLVRADKVQPSLEPKYTGPFRVLRRWGKVFRLRLENRDDTVSVDRLRPFYEAERDGGLQQPVPADPEPR